MEIDEHIGCAMSGLIADARTLVEHARVETQVFRETSLTFKYLCDSGKLLILCCCFVLPSPFNRTIDSLMVSP